MDKFELGLKEFEALNGAFGSLPLVTLVFDVERQVVAYGNPKAAQYFGASAEELSGRKTEGFMRKLSDKNKQVFEEASQSANANGWEFEDQIEFNSSSGKSQTHGCVAKLDEGFFGQKYVALFLHEWASTFGGQVGEGEENIEALSTVFSNGDIKDALTGLNTKRILDPELNTLVQQASTGGSGFTCIMTDIDRFSDLNNAYGAAAGNRVLKEFASRLKNELRGRDKIFRIGGEEFLLILPTVEYTGVGFSVAERLRRTVEMDPVAGHRVTASFGILTWDESMDSTEKVYAALEEALAKAKESGRNMVCQVAA